MSRALKTYFLLLIGLCFVDVTLSLGVMVGLQGTPLSTPDSHGRPMGIYTPLSLEDYGIALANVRRENLFRPEFSYQCAVVVAILAGFWCLWSESRWARAILRGYFPAQLILFAPGIFGMGLIWPIKMLRIISFQADRGTFKDYEAGLILTQTPWFLLSLTIAMVLKAQPLTPKESSESEEPHAGSRDFIGAH